jgi:hypothetical protein
VTTSSSCVQLYIYGFSKIAPAGDGLAGFFYHPGFKRNNKASSVLLRRRDTCTEDRRLKKRRPSDVSDVSSGSVSSSLQQAKKKKRQEKSKTTTTTQEQIESVAATTNIYLRNIIGDALEELRQPPPPSLVQNSTKYYSNDEGNTFEAVSSAVHEKWQPQRNEDSLLSLLLWNNPMASHKMSTPPADFSSCELSTILHDEEECWYDLEPRPIEDMIASS